MNFDEIESSTSGMVADIFINSKQEIHLDKRVEYSTQVNTKFQSLVTIVDFDGEDSSKIKIFKLDVSEPCPYPRGPIVLTASIDMENSAIAGLTVTDTGKLWVLTQDPAGFMDSFDMLRVFDAFDPNNPISRTTSDSIFNVTASEMTSSDSGEPIATQPIEVKNTNN